MSMRGLAVFGIGDPETPLNMLKPNTDGSINVDVVGQSGGGPTYDSAGTGQLGLSVGATAVGLTPPVGAKYAQISVSGANVRYRDDGADPTAAVGYPIYQASSWLYAGPLSTIKFIAQSGTATLDILYYS